MPVRTIGTSDAVVQIAPSGLAVPEEMNGMWVRNGFVEPPFKFITTLQDVEDLIHGRDWTAPPRGAVTQPHARRARWWR